MRFSSRSTVNEVSFDDSWSWLLFSCALVVVCIYTYLYNRQATFLDVVLTTLVWSLNDGRQRLALATHKCFIFCGKYKRHALHVSKLTQTCQWIPAPARTTHAIDGFLEFLGWLTFHLHRAFCRSDIIDIFQRLYQPTLRIHRPYISKRMLPKARHPQCTCFGLDLARLARNWMLIPTISPSYSLHHCVHRQWRRPKVVNVSYT